MGTDKERDGFDRRQFLRRAAVAGAAAAWATPVVKTIVGTPAFATDVTGSPKDLSYIVVFYSCNSQPECAVKWDMNSGVPETANFNMPDCGGFSNATCGDPNIFEVSGGGSAAMVCLTPEAFDEGCRITRGFAKAGSFQSTSNPCAPGAVGGFPPGCLHLVRRGRDGPGERRGEGRPKH